MAESTLKSGDLTTALGGTLDQRLESTRTILITMHGMTRPEIIFTGFWNGKLLKGAFSSVARAYRKMKFKEVRPFATVENVINKPIASPVGDVVKQGVGDGRSTTK